jgi:putative SOS response-associated peptidase YedK
MCGRYRLSRRKQLIQEYFDTTDEVDWEPRYNIAPSQEVGIIRQDRAKPERRFSLAHWGLIPYWAKDASIGYRLINARSETVGSKPAFRGAFENRRCLIPADGFYEVGAGGKGQATLPLWPSGRFANLRSPACGTAGRMRAGKW